MIEPVRSKYLKVLSPINSTKEEHLLKSTRFHMTPNVFLLHFNLFCKKLLHNILFIEIRKVKLS